MFASVTSPIKNLASLLLVVLIAATGFSSCDRNDDDDDMTDPGFDRGVLLQSAADNIIIPNFESLQTSVNDLSTAADAFVQTTDESNLVAMRTAWVQAATDHQHCSAFGFGPAELVLGSYAEVLGVFPVNESGVEQAMLDPNFDLPNSFDRDIRGYFAVEYLIYGNGLSDGDIVAGFDQNRKDYLQLIIGELKGTVDNIVNTWKTSYREEFVSSTGTSAGSPISLYYNAWVKDYENLKNFKLELPGGLSAGQTGPDGTLVEAYYSGISRNLIIEHFANSKNIWFGASREGQDGVGFEEYLETVVGGPDLITQTKAGITLIDNAIADLPPGPLSDNVGETEIRVARDQFQNNTANFKSSMSSLLGIDITFNSGDGD